jgi:hypothetical protein
VAVAVALSVVADTVVVAVQSGSLPRAERRTTSSRWWCGFRCLGDLTQLLLLSLLLLLLLSSSLLLLLTFWLSSCLLLLLMSSLLVINLAVFVR